MAESKEELKSLLKRIKEESEKGGFVFFLCVCVRERERETL